MQSAAMSSSFDEVRALLSGFLRRTGEASHRLELLIKGTVERARRRTDAEACRLSPVGLAAHVAAGRVRYGVAVAARDAALRSRLNDRRSRLRIAAASLDALSPLGVLERGYALAAHGERLLRDAHSVKVGDDVHLRLARGSLKCRVEEIQ